MRRRLLGRTGLVVSEFALGTMTFGREADETTTHEIIDAYVELGGNLVDTADIYLAGVSEELIGGWLRKRDQASRDRLLIATKCRWPMDDSGNGEGLSRHWVLRACEASLRRLGTDHIDLYQAHMWDPITPIEETLDAFDRLVRDGKVRYVGLSNFTGWQVERTVLTARYARQAAPVSLQPEYSLLARGAEWELVPVCLEENLSILPWGPLGQGWLTGKYRRDARPTGTNRLAENPDTGWMEAYDRRNTPRTWQVVDAVKMVSGQLGVAPAQVALRWLADRPGVTAPIVGARSAEQLRENLGASRVVLDEAQRNRLDLVSAHETPPYPYALIEESTAERRRLLSAH